MENGRASLALLPTCLDEGKMTVEPARTWGTAVGHEAASSNPTAHGVAGCADTAGDLLGRYPFAVEAQGCLAAVAPRVMYLRRWRALRRIVAIGGGVHEAVRHASDLGLVPLDDAAQRLGSIDQQVPAIGDLHRRRCTRARGLGVGP